MTHISGKKIAEVIEHLLQFDRFALYGDNIRLAEQAETEQLAAAAKSAMGQKQQAMGDMMPQPEQPEGAPLPEEVPTAMDQSRGVSNRR